MKVADLIGSRKEVYSITEETSVHQAAQYLREKQVRSVGVVDTGGKVVGVISHSDVSDKVAAENKCPAWMRVTEIMTANPTAVSPETSLEECLLLMEKLGAFHLPVIDPKEGYRGMVSVKDLLNVIASDQKARADMLESYIFSKR
jgi:CBS domain-containing protein